MLRGKGRIEKRMPQTRNNAFIFTLLQRITTQMLEIIIHINAVQQPKPVELDRSYLLQGGRFLADLKDNMN